MHFSFWHVLLHPSPLTVLPSSHVSVSSTSLLPQTGQPVRSGLTILIGAGVTVPWMSGGFAAERYSSSFLPPTPVVILLPASSFMLSRASSLLSPLVAVEVILPVPVSVTRHASISWFPPSALVITSEPDMVVFALE